MYVIGTYKGEKKLTLFVQKSVLIELCTDVLKYFKRHCYIMRICVCVSVSIYVCESGCVFGCVFVCVQKCEGKGPRLPTS